MKQLPILLVFSSLLLPACGGVPIPNPNAVQTPHLAPSTPIPASTNTPLPTGAPLPATATPLPTPIVSSGTGRAARVLHIIDGDTIEVEIDGQAYSVRYIGIDAPERDMPFYQEARQANAALVAGQDVWLEKDVSETDRYGRLLRYVYVGSTLINEELLRQGYAQVVTYPPDVKYHAGFLAVQQEAQAAGVGLWAQAAATEPPPGQPTAAVSPSQPANCAPSYPDVCIPPPPPDLDCWQIPYRAFRVLPPDPHNFDGGQDGIGCESE